MLPILEGVMELAQVRKGSILFKQGDRGDAAFLVTDGIIGIYREAEGQKTPLATIRQGELFGEMAVIDGSPRMATAFAVSDATLTVISADTITEKMRKADPFIKSLVQMLLRNLRTVHNSYVPKPRSLHDAIGALERHRDILSGFLKAAETNDFTAGLTERLKPFNAALESLQAHVAANRGRDRRDNSVPDAAALK
jgi:CRP-like cAMP-binding protein